MNRIDVVGIGPGNGAGMTGQARMSLEQCDVIVGYTVYNELLQAQFPEKEYRDTPMRREVERCELAFSLAEQGKRVAVVCSGDAGVYGMSGLMEELACRHPETQVRTVPGVTAAMSGAALLGAPLMHDFAVISLSDLLTPWETIERRLQAAAQGDFVICLYNPSSHKRGDYLQKACDLVLRFAAADTVCGIAKNIGREGEQTQILSLSQLRDTSVDMFSTVFIGNSQTKVMGGKMVTPRGYRYE